MCAHWAYPSGLVREGAGSFLCVDSLQRDIRFATTEDGVSIAYWEIGQGKPVVVIQNWGISHAELEWTVPSIRSFYTAMAERYRLIRFDPRGIGLSDDPPGGWGSESSPGVQAGMSIHEVGSDITAVTQSIGLESFALMAVSVQGPVGIEFAATNPELVSELILCQTMADVADSALSAGIEIQRRISIMQQNSTDDLAELYKDPWHAFAPEEDSATVTRLKKASDSRINLTLAHPQFDWNARQQLGNVTMPCLILCSRNLPSAAAERVLAD